MAQIIALVNQKGGVTKTTSAFNIGTALALRDHKVLLVDLDSQASLTISAGLEMQDLEYTICDILRKSAVPTKDIVVSLGHITPNLDLIPSIIDLAAVEIEMLSRPAREGILARALEQVKEDYDYIIIDCPPQLSILTANGLSASDSVIIPCKTDYLSYRGLTQLMETIDDIKRYVHEDLEIIGIIATLYESATKEHNEILEHLKENYNVIGVLKKAAAATKGIYDGLPVVLQHKSAEISQEYGRIADYIIKTQAGRGE